MSNKVFQIYSNCIPVKGAKRSIIYDLNRNDFDFIPNTMIDFIEHCSNRTMPEIIKYFGEENEDSIVEYMNFLESKEYCFWIDKNEIAFFPKMDLKYDYPSIISNCVIEIDTVGAYLIEEILMQLKTVHCHHISLIITGKVSMNFIKLIIEKFYNSNIKTIQLILQNNNYSESSVENILELDARINDILITSSKFDLNKIYTNNKQVTFSKLKHKETFNHSHNIYKENFVVNVFLFTESLKYNSYYNKKVSITKEGYIKNCLLDEQKFGNILNNNLKAIVETIEFQRLWNINKDMITICQDCEFRYMCVDSCPINFDKDENVFYRSLRCNYNPYKNEFYD